MNTYRRLLLAVVLAAAVILCPFLQEQAVAQVRDLGTRRLVLDNNAAGRIAIQTQATVTNNYSIALPTDTAGAHSGLLLFTNAGAGALTTSFLASGSNGQVLTISGGVPTWTTAASNWALLGNAATNPSLNFLGTTDGQPVVFRTDNVERMRLSGSATRLGIGNTNPTYTLDVTGDARFTTQIGVGVAPDVNLSARFRHPSSSTVLDLSTVNANDDAYFRFNDNAATRFAVGLDASQGDFRFNRSSVASLGANSDLIIDGTTGNVGVRVTSTPHRRLTVTEATNAATAVFGAALSTGQYTGLYISYYQEALGDVSQNAGIFFESTSNAFGTLHLVNKSSGTANATPADARLSVLSTGEVGIGTPTPASGRLLHVAGTAGTSNVRMGSLSGAAVATAWTPTANDGIVVSDNNGDLLKRSVSSVLANATNIYNANGSLTSDRLVTVGNRDLQFRNDSSYTGPVKARRDRIMMSSTTLDSPDGDGIEVARYVGGASIGAADMQARLLVAGESDYVTASLLSNVFGGTSNSSITTTASEGGPTSITLQTNGTTAAQLGQIVLAASVGSDQSRIVMHKDSILLSADSVVVRGALHILNATNPLRIVSLGSGAATDSVLTINSSGVVRLRNASSFGGWSLLGNAGTSAATNFLGTTDNQALMFRVNNQPMGTLNEALGAVAFGENALQSNASGSALIAIGEDALRNTTDNSTLLGIGRYAGRSLTGGAGFKNNHFFLGHYAGENFDNDEDPVTIIGNYAYNQGGAGLGLVIVGYRAAFSMNSDNATVIGAHAGENIVSGSGSVIIGAQAMQTATSANNVVAIGENVMNSAIAPNSGNVAIGSGALQSLTTGSNNVGVGSNVGNSLHTIGSGNVYLGANAGPSVGGLNNAIAIGQNSVVSQSNSLILGGTGADQVDVGIGVTAPTNRLHVVSTANPIRAVGLQSGAGTDSVVTVDAAGVLRMRNASNFGGGIHEEVTAGQGNVRRRLLYTNGTAGAPVGQFSNDLQGSRTLATQTASGNFSVVPGGQNNTVSGSHSLAFGYGANVAQNNTIVFNHPTVGDGETRVGIDIDNPQTSLDVDGGVVVRPPAVVNVNANNFNLVVGNRSYIVLNPAGANRTGLILANGLQAGQLLILRIIDGQANTIQLPDNAGVNNVNTSGNWVGGQDDTMTLIWNGADWVELSRSNN